MTGRQAKRLLWLVLKANGGFDLERSDQEDFPGDDRAAFRMIVGLDGSVRLEANELVESPADTSGDRKGEA